MGVFLTVTASPNGRGKFFFPNSAGCRIVFKKVVKIFGHFARSRDLDKYGHIFTVAGRFEVHPSAAEVVDGKREELLPREENPSRSILFSCHGKKIHRAQF